MSLKDLRNDASLSVIEDELDHTAANLEADPLTTHLTADAHARLTKAQSVRAEQRSHKRRRTRAQARINYLNRALDTLCRDLVPLLVVAYKTREDAGFRRYFPKEAPNLVIRKGLESQLDDCARWPDHLASEPHASLRDLAPRFASVIADAQAAVKDRADLVETARLHRLDAVEPLIRDLNTYRQGLYAALLDIATKHGFDKSWPRDFFM